MDFVYCNLNSGMTVPALGNDPDPVRLTLKVFLEGPYVQASDLMSDALRTNNRLPWNFPYSILGYTLTRHNTASTMDALATRGRSFLTSRSLWMKNSTMMV